MTPSGSSGVGSTTKGVRGSSEGVRVISLGATVRDFLPLLRGLPSLSLVTIASLSTLSMTTREAAGFRLRLGGSGSGSGVVPADAGVASG